MAKESVAIFAVIATTVSLVWWRTRRCSEGSQVHIPARTQGHQEAGGILKRTLFVEPKSGRFALELVFGPHTKYPSHLHGSNEWCFIAQGELLDNFGLKRQGDFFYNELGSVHHSIQAGPMGCIIHVVKDRGENCPLPHLDQKVSSHESSGGE